MALVHSRVTKVFYAFNTIRGYLHTNNRIHCLPSLNHNYEVFEVNDIYSDSGCSSYFTDESTKHKNILEYKNKK